MKKPIEIVKTKDRFVYGEKTLGQLKTEEDIEEKLRRKITSNMKQESSEKKEVHGPTSSVKMVLTPVLKSVFFDKWWSLLEERDRLPARKGPMKKAYLAGLVKGTECVLDQETFNE